MKLFYLKNSRMVIKGNTFYGEKIEKFSDMIFDPTKPYLWMYWENKPGVTSRPVYLDMCAETVYKHCANDFNIVILNETTVNNYIDFDFNSYKDIWSIPQKADFIRLYLLKYYGGIWLDSDIIVMKSLKIYYDMLMDESEYNYDYMGFGCYYGHCEITMNGYGGPANWVMVSKRNGLLINLLFERANYIVRKNSSMLKKNYHCLGKDLLASTIDYLRRTVDGWRYLHISSKCVERNSLGKKLTNQMLLSDVPIDESCISNYVFVPCYNTAPSFPDWFKMMNRNGILTMNALIGRLFRLALGV